MRSGISWFRRALRAVRRRGGEELFSLCWRVRPGIGRPSIRLWRLLRILYPRPFPSDLRLERAAYRAAGSSTVRDVGSVRRVLASLDTHSAPSPVSVRISPADLCLIDVASVRLAVDAADVSVSDTILRTGQYEPHLTALLQDLLRPGTTFADVGANIGYYAMLGARLVGPSGRVVAFEPSPENCRLLLHSMQLNGFENVELFPVALSDVDGWSYLERHLGSNGSVHQIGVESSFDGWRTIVPTFTLDRLYEGPLDVMKMDVEGSEARVLRGATRVIEKNRPVILTEVSDAMLRRCSGSSLPQFLSWFAERSYQVAMIEESGELTWILEPQQLVETWGDEFRIESLLLRP